MDFANTIDYENIYNSSPDMCLSLEPTSGRIIECNQTLIDVLGYSKEEILNASLFDIYADSEHQKVIDNLNAIKANRSPKDKEFVIQKKNGEHIEVTLKLTFVRNEGGEILYTNAVWRDIKDLKETEQALKFEKDNAEQKNRELLSAVSYARRIQSGILPTLREINDNLPNSFVFFRPKDIVSGDFYCLHSLEDEVLFSVFDCTGHGIPGGFVSMLGSSLMNQIVLEGNCFKPESILNKLRAYIITYLKQGEDGSTSDGMDGGVCIYNKKESTLKFAGANSSLIVIRAKDKVLSDISGNEYAICQKLSSDTHHLYEIKGDRQPIGYYGGLGSLFHGKSIRIERGDVVYIYSDGFQDQFGGEHGKKYLTRRFRELLLKISSFNCHDQYQLLEGELSKWQGELEQTDDICVWGARF